MANSAIRVMDAAGLDIIMVETVGVGQTELDVMKAVDTVIVVMVPEAGDGIQALKAGLIESADIFVVNKADREGSQRMEGNLEAMLNMADTLPWWRPPIVQTEANQGKGIETLYELIQAHKRALNESSRLKEKRYHRNREEFLRALRDGLVDMVNVMAKDESGFASRITKVEEGSMDPISAAFELLGNGDEFKKWISDMDKRTP
jgi:LAO/AO transport system kinase